MKLETFACEALSMPTTDIDERNTWPVFSLNCTNPSSLFYDSLQLILLPFNFFKWENIFFINKKFKKHSKDNQGRPCGCLPAAPPSLDSSWIRLGFSFLTDIHDSNS